VFAYQLGGGYAGATVTGGVSASCSHAAPLHAASQTHLPPVQRPFKLQSMADVHGAARLGAGSSTSARATLASGCARHNICSWQPPATAFATAARWQGGDGSVSTC
jgi:hypothetical protein